MTRTKNALLIATLLALSLTTGCANTIRGAGSDGAKAVDATQNAGRRVGRAIRN